MTTRSPWPSGKRMLVAAAAGAQQQWARGAERDDRDHRVDAGAAADGVAVPGDAVAAVAVEAHAGGDEGLAQLLA